MANTLPFDEKIVERVATLLNSLSLLPATVHRTPLEETIHYIQDPRQWQGNMLTFNRAEHVDVQLHMELNFSTQEAKLTRCEIFTTRIKEQMIGALFVQNAINQLLTEQEQD